MVYAVLSLGRRYLTFASKTETSCLVNRQIRLVRGWGSHGKAKNKMSAREFPKHSYQFFSPTNYHFFISFHCWSNVSRLLNTRQFPRSRVAGACVVFLDPSRYAMEVKGMIALPNGNRALVGLVVSPSLQAQQAEVGNKPLANGACVGLHIPRPYSNKIPLLWCHVDSCICYFRCSNFR